jgi:hypothetical protein
MGTNRNRHPSPRRFSPPWTVEEYNDACFIVRGHNGHKFAYIYYEDEPRGFNTTAMSRPQR